LVAMARVGVLGREQRVKVREVAAHQVRSSSL